MKKHMHQLAEVAAFVNSKFCPSGTNHSEDYMGQLDKWYTNIINKLHATVKTTILQATPTHHNITLTEIWDCLKAEWAAYHQEVRGDVGGRGVHAL